MLQYSTFGLFNAEIAYQKVIDGILTYFAFFVRSIVNISVFSGMPAMHQEHICTILGLLLCNGLIILFDSANLLHSLSIS